MKVQELIDELNKIEDKSLPVCLIEREEIRYSDHTTDTVCTPVDIESITFRRGFKLKSFRGLERKDRIELDGY